MPLPQLDPSAASVLLDLHAKLSAGTALQGSDPLLRRAAGIALEHAGRTSVRYPALHRGLAGDLAGNDSLRFVDSGFDSKGRATAWLWASSAGARVMGGTVFAFDDSGDLVACGSNTSVASSFLSVSTETATAQPSKNIRVLAVTHSTQNDGSARISAAATTAAMTDVDADITIDQPVKTITSQPDEILIAVGRDSTHNPDVDYYYTEPEKVQGDPYLIVPFVGNAVLPYEVDGTAGESIPNAVLETYIYFDDDGTNTQIQLDPSYGTPLATGCTMSDSDSYTVDWSYAFDGASYSDTTSLVYEPQSLVNETDVFFFFQFTIPVKNAPVSTYAFAVCSNDTPDQPSIQCEKIKDLYFWWHCLAADTSVSLEDGGSAAISTLRTGARVVTADGRPTRCVEATTRGHHTGRVDRTGAAGVYRLQTSGGRTLTGTGAHPVRTPSGLVSLADLQPGQDLHTEGGIETVASCAPIDFEGEFFNLALDGGAAGDFLANGIVVAAARATRAHSRAVRLDLDVARRRVPEALLTDYRSAVEDRRY